LAVHPLCILPNGTGTAGTYPRKCLKVFACFFCRLGTYGTVNHFPPSGEQNYRQEWKQLGNVSICFVCSGILLSGGTIVTRETAHDAGVGTVFDR